MKLSTDFFYEENNIPSFNKRMSMYIDLFGD